MPWSGRGGDTQHVRPNQNWHHVAQTDGAGSHVLHVALVSTSPTVAHTVTRAGVGDGRQPPGSGRRRPRSSSIHRCATSGCETKKPFVELGTPYDVDVIGVDLDGKATPGANIDARDRAHRRRVQARRVHHDGARAAALRRGRCEGCRAVPDRDAARRSLPDARDDPRRQGPREPHRAGVLGRRWRRATGARGHARSCPADTRSQAVRAGHHRRDPRAQSRSRRPKAS